MGTHPMIVGVTDLLSEARSPSAAPRRPVRTAVELRLDIGNAWRQVLDDPSLLAERVNAFRSAGTKVAPPPVMIATCRREQDGGAFEGNEPDRIDALEIAGRLCDYVDVETGVETAVPAAKTIRSFHDFDGVPDFEAVLKRLRKEGGALFKIAGMAEALSDNLKVREFLAGKPDVTAFLMGEYGVPSRILALAWGSRLTYATLGARPTAPGMLDFQGFCELYRADTITEEHEIFGITGEHVRHSHSPAIHNVALRRARRKAVYLPLAARDVDDWFAFASEVNVAGASVTIPFKEAILPHCEKLDEASEATGAVNTLLRLPGGGWRGRNVDWSGLLDDVKVQYDGPLFGRTALVLGAGGAARAAVYGLKREGIRIRVWNRHHERAQRLCSDIGGTAVGSVAEAGRVDVLVNCTPCGMEGDYEDETAVAWDELKPLLADDALVYDMVYQPHATPLIKSAARDGFRHASGIGMLKRQAALQAQIFGYPLAHGLPSPKPRTAHIWLVGFRGAGKSSLARELAIRLRRRAVDTDAMIELQHASKVRNIIETRGEEAFREMEAAAVLKAGAVKPDTVIAAGGGAVERPENIDAMRRTGMVIYLDAPVDLLLKRLRDNDDRPALTDKPFEEEVRETVARRRPLYENAAQFVVRVQDDDARVLAGEVAEMLAEFHS